VPIPMTRPPNRRTVADDDEHAARLEALGFVRDDAEKPKIRAPRKSKSVQPELPTE
jgi:hypothetical protein